MGSNITAMEQGTVLDMLADIDRGSLVLDMEEYVKECVQAAMDTGRKSSVSITITFDPDKQTGAFRVSGQLKQTLPEYIQDRRASQLR